MGLEEKKVGWGKRKNEAKGRRKKLCLPLLLTFSLSQPLLLSFSLESWSMVNVQDASARL